MNFFESNVLTVDRPTVFDPNEERRKAKGLWRTEDPVMVDGKVVKGGLWPAQRLWWNLPNFIKVLVGGYGAGKTNIACKRAIALALTNAPCPVAMVSPTFPLARQTIIATLQAMLSGRQTIHGQRAFWWRYNKSSHEFRIRFHGRNALIIVYSGEDPLSLRGPNLAAALIDEPFIQDLAVFEQMIARVRHPDAVQKEIGLTGTPEQLNWGYDLCLGDMKERHDVAYVQASTRGNLAVGGDYVKRLEGAFTDKAAEAYIEGSFVQLGTGLVYYAFTSLGDESNVRSLPIPPGAELGCGMDFNVNPMAGTVFWRAGSHLHFFDEIELPNSDTQYMCQVLNDRYVTPGHRERKIPADVAPLQYVYPDATGSARKTASPAGKTDFHWIREAGFEIRGKNDNPKVRDRENAMNGKFSPKVGKTTLTVDPSCKKLIKYLHTYSHELKNKQEAMSHLLSAAGYPVAFLYPVSKDILGQHKLTGW